MSKYHRIDIQSLKYDLKPENQDNFWTNMLHILAQRGAFVDTQKIGKDLNYAILINQCKLRRKLEEYNILSNQGLH